MICTFDIVRLGTYNEEKDLRHFGTEKRLYKDVKNSKPGENGRGKRVLSLFQTEENRLF